MPRLKAKIAHAGVEYHKKAPDGLQRFRKAAGSIRLKGGEAPSHKFMDERADRGLEQRARD